MSDKTPPEDELNIVDLTSEKSVSEVKVEPIKVDKDVLNFLKELDDAFPDKNLLDTVKAYKMVRDQDTMQSILSQIGIGQPPM
jgi:hypothetical protein